MDKLSLYRQEIEKSAGFPGALKGAGKFMSRTATGAILGAGLGATKGVNANANDPNASQGTKELNVAGGLVGGALLGAVAGGPGIGMAKKIGKKLTPGFLKKSEMEVPTEEEKGTEEDEARKEVEESPNRIERNRMRHTIDSYKKEIEKSSLSKMAKYMEDVKCEKCGLDITPNSEDGRCPNCGALGGILPKPNPSYNRGTPLVTKDQTIGRLMDEVYSARQNLYNMF